MAIKITSTGQTTFVKEIRLGTPVSNIREAQGILNTSAREHGDILIYDSGEGFYKAGPLVGGTGISVTHSADSDNLTLENTLFPTSFSFDDNIGEITLNRADGSQIEVVIGLGAFTTDSLSEGLTNLYYTTSRHDSDFDVRLAIQTTDNINEGETNLYYTNARVDSHLSSGLVEDIQTSGNVIIGGDLTVQGETTTLNTTELTVEDKNIILADGALDSLSADQGGITLAGANATLLYDHINSKWKINRGLIVEGDLVPSADITYDLGSSSAKWKDLHLSGSTIFLGGLKIQDSSNQLIVKDSNDAVVEFNLSGSQDQIRGFFGASGDLSYDSSTGVFSFDVEQVYTKTNFDSDFNIAIDEAALGGTGLSYDSATNTLSITDTGVASGTYGSASQVPVFTVNAQGQVDSIGSVSVAGVSSTSYDSATGIFTINTADGGSFTTTFHDSDDRITEIRTAISGGGDLTYNSLTGEFTIDVEQIYTKANFDSDLGDANTGQLPEGSNLYYTTSRHDSDTLTQVDSAYVQLRQDFAYSSLTGTPTNVSTFTNDANYLDSTTVQGVIDSTYVQANQITYNTSNFTDSAYVLAQVGSVDSAYIKTVDYLNNETLSFGNASDLQIYSNGTNSFISEGGIGDLVIQGGNIRFETPSSEYYIRTYNNGKVALYYDNSVKLETSATGVTVTGSVNADSATFSGAVTGDSFSVGEIAFRTDFVDSHIAFQEGALWYDPLHKNLNYYTDFDHPIEIGMQIVERCYNDNAYTINKGQPLYYSGNRTDELGQESPTVALANATSSTKYNVQGLAAEDIPPNSYGQIVVAGVIDGFDTSALTAGLNFFAGLTDGSVQNAPPTYPNYPMCLGWVIKSDATDGKVIINQQNHSVNSFRVQGNTHISANLVIDGDLTVAGTQTITSTENVQIGGNIQYLNAGNTIGEAGTTFVGSGLDDAFFAGHYSGDSSTKNFYVEIDSAGDTDTFEWGFDSLGTPEATGVVITGAEQELAAGIKIDFGAVTGHTLGDKWTGRAIALNTDTGLFSNKNEGDAGNGYTHVGLYWDATEDEWTFVGQYDSEPEAPIDRSSPTFQYGDVRGKDFYGTTFSGALSGNATTATRLQTARNFSLTGDITASAVSFDGTGVVQLTTAYNPGSIVNADINASAGIVDTKLATISTAGKVSNSATTATSANTASAIVARDGSGNFSAGTITASLSGNVTGNIDGDSGDLRTFTSNNITAGQVNTTNLEADSASITTLIVTNTISGNIQTADSATTAATAANANLLNGQLASYYLNYNNFTNTPTTVSTFTNDANYLDSTTVTGVINAAYIQANQRDYIDSALAEYRFMDSGEVVSLVDSAYVQLRQDYAYSSLTGVPTTVSTFTNDANYLDSITATSLFDSAYVQARQSANLIDSAYIKTVDYLDGEDLYFGTDNDLRILAQSNAAYVLSTGSLELSGQNVTIGYQSAFGIEYNNSNKDVTINFDGNQRFITTATGITVTGEVIADSATVTNITASNTVTAGSLISSNIYNTSGNLSVDATQILDLDGLSGGVKISHETYQKLITTATGIDITGEVVADSATVTNISLPTNGKATFGTNDDYSAYFDGTDFIIGRENDTTGTFKLVGRTHIVSETGENLATFSQNGKVRLYYDNALKLETESDGVTVTGEVVANSATIAGLNYPTADGTTGQFLKTDGSGNLSFDTVVAGGGGLDSDLIEGMVDSAYVIARAGSLTISSYEYTATAGQTSFTGSDDNTNTLSYTTGYLDVYLNGVLLSDTIDYTADDGLTITLETSADSNDFLTAKAFSANAVPGVSQTLIDGFTTTSAVIDSTGGGILTSYSAAAYRTQKHIIDIQRGGAYQSQELLITHNGSDAFITSFAVITAQDSNLGTFDAIYNSGAVEVKFYPSTTATHTVKSKYTSTEV